MTTAIGLRLRPTLDSQASGIRWAADHDLVDRTLPGLLPVRGHVLAD